MYTRPKGRPIRYWDEKEAGAVGFEPTGVLPPLVFKTSALVRSATPPNGLSSHGLYDVAAESSSGPPGGELLRPGDGQFAIDGRQHLQTVPARADPGTRLPGPRNLVTTDREMRRKI